jgi:CTP:molybdopterin cytidylyltransferase MocA
VSAGRPPPHGALLLAAGASRRLGRPKQLVQVDGEPLIRRAARALLATGPLDAVVVLAGAEPRFLEALAGLAIRPVVAADAARGLAASLRCGLAALASRCEGALVALTDQPALAATHLLALRDAWRAAPAGAAASAYAGVIGVPALLPRGWFAELSGGAGDAGARVLLRARRGEVRAVDLPALARDIDLAADLAPPGGA